MQLTQAPIHNMDNSKTHFLIQIYVEIHLIKCNLKTCSKLMFPSFISKCTLQWPSRFLRKQTTLTWITNVWADFRILKTNYWFQILGSKGDMETKIDANTRQKIQELNMNVQKNKELALSRLLNICLDIKAELHTNLRL